MPNQAQSQSYFNLDFNLTGSISQQPLDQLLGLNGTNPVAPDLLYTITFQSSVIPLRRLLVQQLPVRIRDQGTFSKSVFKTSSVAGHKSTAVTSKYGTLANGLKQLPTSKTFILSGTFFTYRHCEQSNSVQESNKHQPRKFYK
uniref:Uncharacterized protein n=1 Tax=Glossina palpalis gambiensis TaxID=67801 RepID=A0A1B0BH44_9MUSC